MKENKMFRLSLQFFGENGGEDKEDDFTDEFFDDDVPEYYGADNAEDEIVEDNAADNADDADDNADDADDADDNANDADDNADDADDNANNAEDNTSGAENGTSETSNNDLISELRALGYVGNDLASLTADMKQKREAKAAEEAKAQKAADKADGKAHVRSGAPGKSATGDGTGGISERQVAQMVESTGCSKETARELLAKHARLIEGK